MWKKKETEAFRNALKVKAYYADKVYKKMSIEKNRQLMIEQIQRLKGQLNEDSTQITHDEISDEVLGGIYETMVSAVKKKYVKIITPKIKKALVGKSAELQDGIEEYTSSPIKSVSSVWIEPHYEGTLLLMVNVKLEDGKTETLEYYI